MIEEVVAKMVNITSLVSLAFPYNHRLTNEGRNCLDRLVLSLTEFHLAKTEG